MAATPTCKAPGAASSAAIRARAPQVALLGATLSGNRGAEAMLRAAVQGIRGLAPAARFSVLSVYPQEDRTINNDPGMRVVSCTPLHMLLVALPLALAAGALARLRLPYRFLLRVESVRALEGADLAIDLSGISFVDGRGPVLLYNVALAALPILLRKPLLKYAQALGPFRRRINRWCASWLLPKVSCIVARGRTTQQYLLELGVPPERVRLCADAAFALEIGPQARQDIEPILKQRAFQRPVVAVAASSVVENLCRRRGVDYPGRLAAFIRRLIDEKGYGVCLLAHSARPGRKGKKNNDLPVCRRIAELVRRSACVFPEQALGAEALRALIGACRFLVASRFHAMVSGLAAGVPTMLIGWSHKYAEVLEFFGLEAYVLDYGQFDTPQLLELFTRLEREEDDVRRRIARHLPEVIESSRQNARLAVELLLRHAPVALAAQV